jgi:hypothetical protein
LALRGFVAGLWDAQRGAGDRAAGSLRGGAKRDVVGRAVHSRIGIAGDLYGAAYIARIELWLLVLNPEHSTADGESDTHATRAWLTVLNVDSAGEFVDA